MIFGIETELVTRAIPSLLETSRSDAAGGQHRADFAERLMQDKRNSEHTGPRSENVVANELVTPVDPMLVMPPTSLTPEIAPAISQTALAPLDPASATADLTEFGRVAPGQEVLPADAIKLSSHAGISEAAASPTSAHAETATPATTELASNPHLQGTTPGALDTGKAELTLPMAASIGHTRRGARTQASEPANLLRPTTAMNDKSLAIKHPGHDLDGSQLDLSEPRTAATDLATTNQSQIPVDKPTSTESVASTLQLTPVGLAGISEAAASPTSAHAETATPATTELASNPHLQGTTPGALDTGKAELTLPMAASIGHTRRGARTQASEPANLLRPTTAMNDKSLAIKHPGHDLDGSQLDLSEPRTAATDLATTNQSQIPVDKPTSTESVASTLQLTPVGLVAAPPSNAPISMAMAPALGLVSATPAEVIEIISDKLAASDDRRDRVVVQLNPVELGRVSIDFKFDAQGLQHVTITGESPDALRQLRSLHFELIQALEHQGLTGQSMTFQHKQRETHDTPPNIKPTGIPTTSEPEHQGPDRSGTINIATGNSLDITV